MDAAMMGYSVVLLTILWTGVNGGAVSKGELCFSKNFMFGVATASYQIEGAWNTSGKGENIWDRFSHKYPDQVFDRSNGDVACDSYNLYKRDVAMMKELGVQFYRFSISWSRILPTGLSNQVNEDGIIYYNHLIDELHSNGIQPMVTMYHWDLPQELQDLGGWTNPIMADYFVDYANVLFHHFGDRVNVWVTFNEPLSFCHDGYGGMDAPGARSSGFEDYLCAHNVLRAHGMAYRLYQKDFAAKQKGVVGITLDTPWMEAASTSKEDERAAETARQFIFGWFAHPIFSQTGDYPPIMRRRIDEISKRQHFTRSRLPHFTHDEIRTIQGSADFLGYNHYTTYLVGHGNGKIRPNPSYDDDVGVRMWQKNEWPKSNSTWLRVVPWGFRKVLNWIKNTYDNPVVVITENGLSLEAGLEDKRRVAYIDSYLRALHAAIYKDQCNVVGYSYWSLLDNWEWRRGYSERFGLYEVDFNSLHRTRTPRESASFFSHISRTKCLPDAWGNMFHPVY